MHVKPLPEYNACIAPATTHSKQRKSDTKLSSQTPEHLIEEGTILITER